MHPEPRSSPATTRQAADCEILIHRRTAAGNTLWQKERLMNIALENLPRTVDKVSAGAAALAPQLRLALSLPPEPAA